MASNTNFDAVLDAIENLSPEAQQDLIALVQRRLAARGRERIVKDVQEAREEHAAGATKPTTVADLIREIESKAQE